jgi:ABC-type branched-subunit amino acid transport system ATPase component
MSHNNPHLCVSGLTVSYDSIKAVQGVSFDVGAGEIVALIGRNKRSCSWRKYR